MNISSDIKPINYLQSKATDLVKQINETYRPAIITQNGEPRAVLQDPESFKKMRNAMGVLKILFLAEEIKMANFFSMTMFVRVFKYQKNRGFCPLYLTI